MKFLKPCFVRVEDVRELEELLQWLHEIGYHVCSCTSFDGWPTIHCVSIERNGILQGEVHAIPDKDVEWGYGIDVFRRENAEKEHPDIDCDTDIELFKSLAAMNDENAYMQYFVYRPKGYFSQILGGWWLCTEQRWIDWAKPRYSNSKVFARKATAEEIIEHFKNRK